MFSKPMLPGFLNEITLAGSSLPAGKVDVTVSRADRGFVVDVRSDCLWLHALNLGRDGLIPKVRPSAIEVVTIN